MSILGPVSGVGGSFFALCAACLRSVAGDLDGHRRDRMPNRKTGAARTPESAPCAGFCISEPYPAQKSRMPNNSAKFTGRTPVFWRYQHIVDAASKQQALKLECAHSTPSTITISRSEERLEYWSAFLYVSDP